MQFSKAILAIAFATTSIAAPAAEFDPRAVTVVSAITNSLAALKSAAGTATAGLSAAAKAGAGVIEVTTHFDNIALALKTASTALTGNIPATTTAIKTQVSALTQAEVNQLTATITALKGTLTGLGGSVSTTTKGLQGITSAFATGEIKNLQNQINTLTAPVLKYAADVKQYASSSVNTAALTAAAGDLKTAVTGQVSLLGLSTSGLPTTLPTLPKVPTTPSVPIIPTIPKLPGLPGLPTLPKSS